MVGAGGAGVAGGAALYANQKLDCVYSFHDLGAFPEALARSRVVQTMITPWRPMPCPKALELGPFQLGDLRSL
jgi:hypothetical protein